MTFFAQQDLALKQQKLADQQQIPKVAAYVAEEKGRAFIVAENYERATVVDVWFIFLDSRGHPAYYLFIDDLTPCQMTTYTISDKDEAAVAALDYVASFRFHQRFWRQPFGEEVQPANASEDATGAKVLHISKEDVSWIQEGCG
ncbi:hypothetical protein [Streptomyces sp. enrichment culture]|uniref:hypothetical protein n=1 Tax=Streptomyces sp. enrichment culture TaxID=1795815 RepID=UPI003F561B31